MKPALHRMMTAILTASTLNVLAQAQQQSAPASMRPFVFMQDMEQPFRELRAQIDDPAQNASSLDLVRRLQQ